MAVKRTDPVVIRVNIEVNPRVVEIEVDRETWYAMTRAERNAYGDSTATEEISNAGGYGWTIDDPEDEAST